MKKKLRTYINEKGETEVTLAFSEKPQDELCDFCSALKPPYKVYDCPDFPHPLAPRQWSRGSWNACSGCSPYIDADDREGLFERCMLMHSFETRDPDGEALKVFQGEFFRLRPGSVPLAQKSGQPESHESHSSSHNQGGGFPDANPSK